MVQRHKITLAMASSNPISPIIISISLLLLLPLCLGSASTTTPELTYHGGPLLGDLNLTLIWYGQFGRAQKNVVRSFIDSLNYNAGAHLQPQVSSWWKFVGSYHEATGNRSKIIKVKVVKQVTEPSYSIGHVFTVDFVKLLVEKFTGGDVNTIPVVFTARDVSVQGLCLGRCSDHGVLEIAGNPLPYIIVGNPETECPESCAWPFHERGGGPVGRTVNPPSGNVAGDAMAIALAQGLVETVTNPYNTGFFEDMSRKPVEAATACQGIFGSNAVAGAPGKFWVDPANGVGFNAYGSRGKKFLVPAIWSPKTKSCWTVN